MKKRRSIKQVVAKLRQADVELGKGLRVPEGVAGPWRSHSTHAAHPDQTARRQAVDPGPQGTDLIQPENPEPQAHIVRAIGKAYRWRQILRREPLLTVRALARRLKISDSQVRKYLPLINLSPAIVRRALDGTLPRRIALQQLLDAGQSLDWRHQVRFLGVGDAT